MKIEKSYEVSPEVAEEVAKIMAENKEKYAFAEGIICECDFNAGLYFEDELKEILEEDGDEC